MGVHNTDSGISVPFAQSIQLKSVIGN